MLIAKRKEQYFPTTLKVLNPQMREWAKEQLDADRHIFQERELQVGCSDSDSEVVVDRDKFFEDCDK